MINMKNMNVADIGWLAGILDGEGTVAIYKGGPKSVSFYNTSHLVMNKVIKILENLGVQYKYSERYANSNFKKNGERFKLLLTVGLYRMQHMKKLLKILYPHLTCKKDNALKILNYKSKNKVTGLPSLSYKEVFNIVKQFDTITPKQLATIMNTNTIRTSTQLMILRKRGLVISRKPGLYVVLDKPIRPDLG